ncbi:4a-hydroxytetrahydrobiopterin dehydratase [Rhodococcus cerastii]|nr:4a-hydroxytetrahydrobiopterin dehydratase [Rhodococcus cerastii]
MRAGRLERTFRCRDFPESIAFLTRIARASETLNHHPNFCVTDKREVSVSIWTHKLDALTSLDFELAAALDDEYTAVSAEVRR